MRKSNTSKNLSLFSVPPRNRETSLNKAEDGGESAVGPSAAASPNTAEGNSESASESVKSGEKEPPTDRAKAGDSVSCER